jgi:hypothetical protein
MIRFIAKLNERQDWAEHSNERLDFELPINPNRVVHVLAMKGSP